MKSPPTSEPARPSAPAARSFFQADKDHTGSVADSIEVRATDFFSPLPGGAEVPGPLTVQAKCAECEDDEAGAEHARLSQDQSESILLQRQPVFESDESQSADMGLHAQSLPGSQLGRVDGELPFFRHVQAKVTVGAPADPLEKEADEVADRVVQRDLLQVQAKRDADARGGRLQSDRAEPEPDDIADSVKQADGATAQLKGEDSDRSDFFGSTTLQGRIDRGAKERTTGLEDQLRNSKGRGRPLDGETRGRMETSFGTDLGDVRIHTGSDATRMARGLGAQAFTHGSDIFFNEGKYNPDSAAGEHLLAHELTHKIQQGLGRNSSRRLRAKLSDHERPEFGDMSLSRLNAEIDAEVDEEKRAEARDPERREALSNVDPAEKSAKKAEMKSTAAPDVNQAAVEKPKIEEENEEGAEKIDNPADLVGEGGAEEASEHPIATSAEVGAALSLSEASLVRSDSIPDPEVPPSVEVPESFEPVDGRGDPIRPDVEGDEYLYAVAQKAQDLRNKGFLTRANALEKQRQSEALEAKWRLAQGGVSDSEQILDSVDEALRRRREATVQGEEALRVSEEKQRTVEAEAPKFLQNAKEAKAESASVAAESQDKRRENQANRPKDPDDRADAEEQDAQLGVVAEKGSQVDGTFGEAEARIAGLVAQNAEAKEKNTRSAEKLAVVRGQLDQADAKSAQLRSSNKNAKAELAAHAAEPPEVSQQARAMDSAGELIIADSAQMETDLLQAQVKYRSDLRAIPGVQAEEEGGDAEPDILQLKPEGDYGNRIDLFRDTFLDAETYRSLEEREAAARSAVEARRREIQRIEDSYAKPFNEYTRWEKIKAGLSAKVSRFRDWYSQLQFTDVKTFLLDAINPLTHVLAIVGGLKMVVNGAVNLAVDLWKLEFWGVIKSAADIATGVAVVAGTITALALALSAAMVALIIVSWGTLAPWAVPVMTAMGSVMKFAGAVAIWSGLAAAALNGVAGVKSLVDMGTAESADQLQAETDDLQQDVAGMATGVAMASIGRATSQFGPLAMRNTGLAVTLSAGLVGPRAVAAILLADLAAGVAAIFPLARFRSWVRRLTRKRSKSEQPEDTGPQSSQKRELPFASDFPRSWEKFELELHPAFAARLRRFRRNDRMEGHDRGGEGQIFRADRKPFEALKRWFKTRLGDMDESVQNLKDAKRFVDADSRLKDDMEVVAVHERGGDWIRRDFDPSSVALKAASGDGAAQAARQRVIGLLEGTTDRVGASILKKLNKESANIHWSPIRNKLLIIDMM